MSWTHIQGGQKLLEGIGVWVLSGGVAYHVKVYRVF